MKILAATDFSTRSNRALRQAGLLAKSSNAQLHIVHTVDDDQPQSLVNMEVSEADRLLGEQTSSMPELQGVQTRSRVITGDPFDGILKAAAEVDANLVVMGSHRKQLLLDIFTGTTIERVIRKGSYPVLMVNHEAQRRYENIIVPVDMSDASAHALKTAISAGLIGEKGATLLHAFAALAKGRMYVANADQASMDRYVADERRQATNELATFLAANKLEEKSWTFRIEEGAPMEIISRAVAELQPDLLVMGTHGQQGLLKVLLGSVTEAALRSLNVDILAVPPLAR